MLHLLTQLHVRDFDLSFSGRPFLAPDLAPAHPTTTVSSFGRQAPPPEPQTVGEATAAEAFSVTMAEALDHRDLRNPAIGQRVRIVSGPSKGLVGILRDITSLNLWQVELDAKLVSSGALRLFRKDEVAFVLGIPCVFKFDICWPTILMD